MHPKIVNLSLLIGSIIISIVILEVALRTFTIFPIHAFNANRVNDNKLGYKLSPSFKESDRNGFRNSNTLIEADIVTIGDSHTYGVNVSNNDCWPQQLAQMTNSKVYNFGIPGYGCLHYYSLLDEAIQLKPKHIILGLYVYNDISGVCTLINQVDYWNKWVRKQNLDITDCLLNNQLNVSSVNGVTGNDLCYNIIYCIKSAFLGTAIGSAIAYIIENILIINPDPSSTLIVNEINNNTLFKYNKISNHKNKTNISNKNILLGLNISKIVFKELRRKSDINNVKFSVAFIPSKENVYYKYLLDLGYELPQDYHQLVDNERYLVNEFSKLLNQIDVMYINVLPHLENELTTNGNIYQNNYDGHPTKFGYYIYAKSIFENIIANKF